LRTSGLTLPELDGIAVGVGPGSFTGLRVGVMAAKTLAYVTGRPLVGLDSLAVVAHNAPPTATRVPVIADAQRGDVFTADFERRSPAQLVCTRPSELEPMGAWLGRLVPGTFVLGPGVDRIRDALPETVELAAPDRNQPLGPALAELAREVW